MIEELVEFTNVCEAHNITWQIEREEPDGDYSICLEEVKDEVEDMAPSRRKDTHNRVFTSGRAYIAGNCYGEDLTELLIRTTAEIKVLLARKITVTASNEPIEKETT